MEGNLNVKSVCLDVSPKFQHCTNSLLLISGSVLMGSKAEKWMSDAFEKTASKWLRNHMFNCRNLYNAPEPWMTPEIWEELQRYWATEDYQNKSN